MSDDLTALGPQGFERLCQALATYVLGPGIIVFGDGPDGGREATFAGLRHYPAREAPWPGHGVLQAKFKQRLLGTGGDTTWLRKQLKAELTAWADPGSGRVRDGQRPQYLIVATNIPLSAVPRTGGKDRINSLIAEFAPAIGLKDWRIWDAVQIGAFLDAHPDVRRSFAALITPSEVLAALRDKLDYPPEVSVVLNMPTPAIRPGQPGNEQAFMPAYEAAGGVAQLGGALGEVQDIGTGFVQYFDGGAAGPAVICASYGKVPVAVALEIWNALQAVGAGAPGGGTTGAGIPVAATPPEAFIGADSDHVSLADGRWGPGRLVRSGDRGWIWQPEISLDSEAFRDRDTWTGRDGAMDLRLRVAARIPAVLAGLRITDAGRARMLETLQHNGLLTMMTRLAARYGLDPGILTWAETPEPAGRNNPRSAAYQASAVGCDGRPAITGSLYFFLPTGVVDDIRAMADLRISFEAVWPDHATDGNGLAEVPADLQVTGPELINFLAQGWQAATAILPLCAAADRADLSPGGAPHLELYIQNEHRPEPADTHPRHDRPLPLRPASPGPAGRSIGGRYHTNSPVRGGDRIPGPRGPRADDGGLRLHEPPPAGAQVGPAMQFAADSPNQAQAVRIPAMAHKRGGLLAQIEADVVNDSVPLSSLLQKCIVLGGQAGSEKMRDWARRELNGYVGAETVPDYRHVPAALMALITNRAGYNGMTQRFNDSVFPRQIRDIIREQVDLEDAILPEGVGVLEALASQGTEEHRLIPSWANFIADTLNKHNMSPTSRVAEVYWSVSNASIRGILVRVRTALAELVAELIALTPRDQEVPDKQAADQAVQFVITGDRPTINYGNTRAGDIVTHSSGSEYNLGPITGNVAAGSSDVTQNYNAGFDITKVREFADLVTEIAGLLGLEDGQQAELSAATSELHEAIEDPKDDKGRMRRAVEAAMGYLKLAGSTALRNAAITAGNQAGSELDLAIRHMHL